MNRPRAFPDNSEVIAAPRTSEPGHAHTPMHASGTGCPVNGHPLAPVLPIVEDVLGEAALACDAVIALTDASGRLIWINGHEDLVRRAAEIGLVVGADVPDHAGGGAVAAALAAGGAMCVAAQEHFQDAMKRWSGAACPIHDPATGAVLGVLDIAGGDGVMLPQTVALVRAVAKLAESELARASMATVPAPRAAASVARARITALGTREAHVDLEVEGERREARLTPRQSEILVLLTASPRGVAGRELSALLYPDARVTSTLHAEVIKLRNAIGAQVLQSRPYRLAAQVTSDWIEVGRHLAAGNLDAAVTGFTGPLLPSSTAPGVVRVRDELTARLRSAVLESGRLDLITAWAESEWGAGDHGMWVALFEALDDASPLRPLARRQVARLGAAACPVAGPGLASGVERLS